MRQTIVVPCVHTDLPFSTICLTAMPRYLEVLAPLPSASGDAIGDGELAWRPVQPREGTLLLNVGQILQRWSGGQLKATLHRVAHPAWLPPGMSLCRAPKTDLIRF